jgi:hypothetical protein
VNPLRSLRAYRCRREFQPPAGTTHVLEYIPPWLIDLDPAPADGIWQLQTLGNWLAGTPNGDYCSIQGDGSMTEEDFGQFDLGGPDGVVYLDEAGYLGRFEVEISDGRNTAVAPVWWIEVAS